MNTKLISREAIDIIGQYKDFRIGNAICSIPYFNNKTTARRAGLRSEVGKGSPKDIFDEIEHRAIEEKIDLKLIDSELLKKFLVNNNIGIDCSGFAYYVLNEESKSRGKGGLDKHLHFNRFLARFKPQMNTDVLTFVNNKNSRVILIKEIQVGDIITMVNEEERNHILIINQIEYQNFLPATIHYVHAIAWPSDGEYGHGIHEGKIEIIALDKTIVEQRWIENEKMGDENYTFTRAQKSKTEIRRLNWFE